MERYCLRVSHPKHDGWWVVNPSEYAGHQIELGYGYAIAPKGAGVSSWEEPELTTVQENLQADGFDTYRVGHEAAKHMS